MYCDQWGKCFLGPSDFLTAVPRVSTGKNCHAAIFPVQYLVLVIHPRLCPDYSAHTTTTPCCSSCVIELDPEYSAAFNPPPTPSPSTLHTAAGHDVCISLTGRHLAIMFRVYQMERPRSHSCPQSFCRDTHTHAEHTLAAAVARVTHFPAGLLRD